MSFFSSLAGVKLKQVHNTLVENIVSIDPKGATEAQIAEYARNVDQLANIAASAIAKAESDANEAKLLEATFNRTRDAAKLYSSKTDKNEATLTKLISDAETLKIKLEAAQSKAANSKTYAEHCKETHGKAVAKLKEARDVLEAATQAQAEAKLAAQEAAQRKRDAQVASGIMGDNSTLDTALDAIKKHTADLQKHATADALTADALVPSEDDEVSKALAEVDAKPAQSTEDRLAALG